MASSETQARFPFLPHLSQRKVVFLAAALPGAMSAFQAGSRGERPDAAPSGTFAFYLGTDVRTVFACLIGQKWLTRPIRAAVEDFWGGGYF